MKSNGYFSVPIIAIILSFLSICANLYMYCKQDNNIKYFRKEKLLDETSLLIKNRHFLEYRLIKKIEDKIEGCDFNVDFFNIDEYIEYKNSINNWNSKFDIHKIKIKKYLGVDYSNMMLNIKKKFELINKKIGDWVELVENSSKKSCYKEFPDRHNFCINPDISNRHCSKHKRILELRNDLSANIDKFLTLGYKKIFSES